MTSRIRTAIQTEFEAGPHKGQGKICNVGEGGAFVGTPQPPNQGETVRLSFRDRKGRRLDVTGLVWWTTDEAPGAHRVPGFGMRLLDESEEYQAFVESLR